MAKPKAGKPMSLEESARRMTALLARKPRARKTRAYLESLPKRKKIVVSPDEYGLPRVQAITFDPEPLARVVRVRAETEAAGAGRKDRMRPRARPKAPPAPPPPAPVPVIIYPWNCRPKGRHHRPWSKSAGRLDRTLELTMRQRLLLYVAQGGRCALCGEMMDGTPFSFSLDHVIPRSLDGVDGFGNLVLCHGECNGRKTNDVPTGCEMVTLLAVNAILGVQPQVF